MQHRTIKSETGLKWRVYKFDNLDEFNTFLHDTNKYFKASTIVLSSGRFRTAEMNFIESLADDLAFKDINLAQSDLFVITKENTSAKLADEERKVKLIKRAAKVEDAEKGKRGRKSSWTPEEIGLIWTDTVENVARQLGKSISSVSLQRRIFTTENPGFIIPEVAKKQKSAKVDKPIQNTEWTQEQLSLLWSKPAMILSQEIGKNFREIGKKRIEWCLSNPDFIIPHVAQFNSKGLPNKLERKKRSDSWTPEQESVLWEDTIENLVSILGRSYHAIYMKRQEFLEQNPDFVIPNCAKSTKSRGVKKITHPIQEVAPILETKTNPVKEKRAYIKKSKQVDNNSMEQVVNNTMKQMADFLNQLSKMPKKIKMNGIELEF